MHDEPQRETATFRLQVSSARRQAWLWLLGSLLVILSAYRWGVALAAWVAPVPFLLALRNSHGWRNRLLLLCVVSVASIFQVAKIITAPLPLALAIPFAMPAAITSWLLLLATEAIRRWRGEGAAISGFVALTGLSEYLSCTFSPLGVWGTGATTQVDHLVLLQFAALFGVPGIGMLIALVAAVIAMVLGAPAVPQRTHIAFATVALMVGVHLFGAIRLDHIQQGPVIEVAGVVVDPGPETAMLAMQRRANHELVLERTKIAAAKGAQLVVWNEAAVFVLPEEEPTFLLRVQALAREQQIDVVAAYAVVVHTAPIRFDNKFTWVTRTGEVSETYQKLHPVPGEPSLRGTKPAQAHALMNGSAGGAICYDFDFPATASALGALQVGLVALPSSDWRGIDPYHSQIARLGAIANGFSVIRPVRAATSVAYDAFGRLRAATSGFEPNQRILIATVPLAPVATWYGRWGDIPVIVFSLSLLALVLIRPRVRATAPSQRAR